MRKILLTKKLSEADARLFDGIPDLDFVTVLEGEREKFDFHMRDAEAVLLSTAYEVKQEVMEKAEALKVISRTGVGVDNVDVPFATKKRVLVLHTPDANSLSVAEHTVTLIASLAKQNVIYDRELRAGNFQIRRSNKSADLVGKTLGLVGCGRIGRLAAEKCRAAFDMHIIGFDPYLKEVADITLFDNLEDVFRNADYVSLHLPLTNETKNMVGKHLLSLMKPTAFIVNTARGGVIDEGALVEALKANQIAGAALYVFEHEPPEADNPLLSLKNVILTPHSAALTSECSARVAREALLGIRDYLMGSLPKYVFNKELLA